MLSFKDIVIDNKPAADGSVDIALSPNQRGQPIVRPIDYRISGKPCILLQFTTEKTAVPFCHRPLKHSGIAAYQCASPCHGAIKHPAVIFNHGFFTADRLIIDPAGPILGQIIFRLNISSKRSGTDLLINLASGTDPMKPRVFRMGDLCNFIFLLTHRLVPPFSGFLCGFSFSCFGTLNSVSTYSLIIPRA